MFIDSNVKLAVNGRRNDPVRMIAQIIVSGIVGQGIFWNFGYDQLGVAMDPKKEFGLGELVASKVYPHLPHTDAMAWTVKVIEIATDFARGPIEGALYVRTGITPDAVANLFTQPLWSTAEAAEKTIGAIIRPERVATQEGVELSLACIYGSLFRMGVTGVIFLARKPLNKYGTRNVERLIHFGVDALTSRFRSR